MGDPWAPLMLGPNQDLKGGGLFIVEVFRKDAKAADASLETTATQGNASLSFGA